MSASVVHDLVKAVDTEKKILLYCGFYPNKGLMNNYLYYLSGFYHFGISILIQLSMVVVIALHINNLSTIADVLMFFTTQAAFITKLIIILKNKHQFCKIEETLSNPIFYKSSIENEKIINYYVESTTNVITGYRILCFLVCATSGTMPLLGSKIGHAMLLGWNPWDSSTIKYYVNSIFQLAALCASAYVNSTIDSYIVIMISVATAQIEILKNNLVCIKYDNVEAKSEFNENIRLHYEILRFVNILQETFSLGILFQIFASVVVICFTGFQMIIVSLKSVQFIFLFIYFLCMMIQVALYCWFGHYLIASSDSIIQSVYMSNWYESNMSLKRSIIIFMERCKQPIILRAGYLFPLSLGTFTSVIRSSYSYFAVLRRIYDPDSSKM